MDQDRCKKCRFRVYVNVGEEGEMMVACTYILQGRGRRPCPAGERCTVFEPRGTEHVVSRSW